MKNNILNGKTITKLKISEDRQALRFETDAGNVECLAEADCCSYTWIEGVELPALGFPAKVLSVVELYMPEGKESAFHKNADVLTFYGLKVVTDRGDIVIDYRNNSNGHYGGNLCWPGDYYDDVMFCDQLVNKTWVDIESLSG